MTFQYEVYGSVIKAETLQVLFYDLSDVIRICLNFSSKKWQQQLLPQPLLDQL